MFELVYYLDDAMALAWPFRAWVGLGGPGWLGWACVGRAGTSSQLFDVYKFYDHFMIF